MNEIAKNGTHLNQGRFFTGGLSSSRVETLADGVFAIAMTLLVLDIKVPHEVKSGELFSTLLHLWPQFAAYAVSFMVLAVYWIGHHYQYHWIKRSDRTFLWINVFFLMSIAFVPFSTALLANYNNDKVAVHVYGANVIFSGIMIYLHWIYAAGKGQLLENPPPPEITRPLKMRILLGILFYIIATMSSLLSPKLSLILFAILPFLYMKPAAIDKFIKHGTTKALS